MRLAFVHGINNEDNTKEEIENLWWEALNNAWDGMGLPSKPKPIINTAYYADILANATNNENIGIAMGVSETSTGYALQFLKEYVDAANITQEELNVAADELGIPREAVAQGIPHEGWLIDFAKLLEKILPDKGMIIAKHFLRQASAYINNKALALKIDNKVKTDIFDGLSDPTIVIAHSLGTVVSYRLLANNQQAMRNIPLFVTLGSPLSVKMFKSILPPKGQLPKPPIMEWSNGRHPDDFITLGRAINRESIGFDGVLDITDIENEEDNKHSVVRYLASPSIARKIYDAL